MKKSGFTLIEVLLVLTLITISIAFAAGTFGSLQSQTSFHNNLDTLLFELRLAQSNANSGLNDSDHGVHLQFGEYTIFEGDTYNSTDTKNRVIELPENLTITNVTLNGGGNDVVFEKPDGSTDEYGTFVFSSSTSDNSATITISSLGTINK